jgi:hypothetical protein
MVTGRDIAIFYACVATALFLLRLFPRSALSRLAFTWLGPVPGPGEYKSHHLWRWAAYAFAWFCQLLAVQLAALYFSQSHQSIVEKPVFQALFWFSIPMLGLVACAGAVLAALAALKAQFFGPNPRAVAPEPRHAL